MRVLNATEAAAVECHGSAAPSRLDPFAQNCTGAYLYPPKREWCEREKHLMQSPLVSTATLVAAGVSFNEFGLSFGPTWDFASPLAASLQSAVLSSSPNHDARRAVQYVLKHDLILRQNKTVNLVSGVAPSSREDRSPERLIEDDLMHTLEQAGVVAVPWGVASALPAPSPEHTSETAHR